MNSYNAYARTLNRVYVAKFSWLNLNWYPESFENYTKYKIKSSSWTRSCANKKSTKSDNQVREHFNSDKNDKFVLSEH